MIITTGIARVIIIYESCFSPVTEKRRKYELSDLAMQVYRNPDELPFTYFRPIRDRLYSWGFDAIKDAQAVMYLGRGDYDSYQIARNDLEDSGWLSPEIEINSLDKIPLGEYLQAGISKMKSTDWA